MKIDRHEFDNEIRQVEKELNDARELVATLEPRLEWLRRGQELYGGLSSRDAGRMTRPQAKPTLAQAILTVVGDGTEGGWTAAQVIDQLRARGWMPNGTSAEHVVRAKLAALARGETPALSRISHGVYEANKHGTSEDS